MVSTRRRYYRSPSPNSPESDYTSDFEPGSDTDEAFEPISTLDTDRRLRVWGVDTIDTMADDHSRPAAALFTGRPGSMPLSAWKLRFQTWVRRQRWRMPAFNEWQMFEAMPDF
jgi:hypothetical protein